MKLLVLGVLLVFIFAGCGGVTAPAGYYDELADCITASGAKFYGAFWCPKCGKQKKSFGDAEPRLPYIECDPRGDNSQTDLCLEKNVQSYPHWVFGDGTVEVAVLTPQELAQRTGCTAPPDLL